MKFLAETLDTDTVYKSMEIILENCSVIIVYPPGGGGGVLPFKRLLGMCRWMGLHFHDWTDYNGVAFLVELLEWDRTFSGFLCKQGFKHTKIRR